MPLPITRGALSARGFGLFSAPATVLDPYFPYVTMLLHGDGTNGAQNNTFLDSSTNNFTITRNGNTTQGSFSPYGSNWGVYFPDSGSNNSSYLQFSLTATTISALQGASQTRECWVNRTATSSGNTSILRFGPDYGTIYIGSGLLTVYNAGNGNAIITVNADTYMPIGVWTHLALTLSSGTATLWINGVSVGTASTNFNTAVTNVQVGGASDMKSVGYISNVRFSNVARYTSTFTPSTTPFVADANTVFLFAGANRFVDTSSQNTTVPAYSGSTAPSIQRFSPFSPSAAYSTSTIGGSGYFDGSGDYLTTGTSPFALTGAFTIEGWIYPLALTSNSGILAYRDSSGGWSSGAWMLTLEPGTSKLWLYANATQAVISNNAIVSNTWTHFAIVRNSSNLITMYINGVAQTATTTNSTNFSGGSGTPIFQIGRFFDGTSYPFTGYESDIRVTTTAVYTSNFTPPTAPLTAITNTQLLLNYTNGGIFDNAMMNNLETVGNAQISTSVVKFGSGSMAFDGSGDYLYVAPSNNLPFLYGSGDFTAEAWIYPSSVSGFQYICSVWGIAGQSDTTYSSWQFRLNSANVETLLQSGGTTTTITGSGTSVVANTWQHVALVRTSNTIKMFVNGTQVASTAYSSTLNSPASAFVIGLQLPNNNTFNGYIDDLRITKGYARYTSNFTPPTQAFQNN